MLFFWDRSRDGWPDMSKNSGARRPYLCTLRRQECFGSSVAGKSMDEVFKYVAFDNSDCGDCLAHALVYASGEKGLDAFLPRSISTASSQSNVNKQYDEEEDLRHIVLEEDLDTAAEARQSSTKQQFPKIKTSNFASFTDIPPHLPMTATWEDTDFSLESVMRPFDIAKTDLRTFCVRLIQRYSYALGSTPSQMYQMKYADKVQSELSKIDGNRKLSMLALNDDIADDGERIDDIVQTWFEKRWPSKEEWEI